METLILTNEVSSAGRLKAAKIADRVIGIEHRLIQGPLLDEAGLSDFFGSVEHATRSKTI